SSSFHEVQRPKLLLVDDEPSVLRGLRRVVATNQPSWEISCANDGAEALELLGQQHFDAVITDLHMPRVNGWALLYRLFEDHPDTLRIVHSSHDGTISGGSVGRLAHRVLPKPATAMDILELTAWALSQRTPRRAAG